MIAKVLTDAVPHIKFPSSAFGVAFNQAITALVKDAEDSAYIPGPGNETAYDNLVAVLEDMKDAGEWEDADDIDVPAKEDDFEFDDDEDIEDDSNDTDDEDEDWPDDEDEDEEEDT